MHDPAASHHSASRASSRSARSGTATLAGNLGAPTNYLRGIDNALSNHIVPAFGDRPLSTLRRSDVQGFVAALSARLAPNSVYTVYRTLSLLLAAAVDDRKIAVSPCVRIKLPSRPTVEVEPPTPGELAELVASAPDRVRGSGGPFGRNPGCGSAKRSGSRSAT